MNIISLTHEEFTENVDFAFKLASKGHSLKIKTKDNIVLLVTAVASEVNDPENPEINIPTPEIHFWKVSEAFCKVSLGYSGLE